MWYLIVSIPDLCRLSYFVDMNMFARLDEIQTMKETKRYGWTDTHTNNMEQYTVCGGINMVVILIFTVYICTDRK